MIRVQFVLKKEFDFALCTWRGRRELTTESQVSVVKPNCSARAIGKTRIFDRPIARVPYRDPPVTFSPRVDLSVETRDNINFRFRIFFFLSLLKEKEEKRESWRNLLINPKDMTRGAARQHGRHESQEKAKILRSQNRKHSQSAKLQEDGEHRARATSTTTGTVVVESQEPTNLNPREEEDDDDVNDKAQQTGDPNTSKTLNNTEKEEEEEEEVVRRGGGRDVAARTKKRRRRIATSEEDGTKEENEQ